MNHSISDTFQVFNFEAMTETGNSLVEVKQFMDRGVSGEKLLESIKIIRSLLHLKISIIFEPLKNESQPSNIQAFFKNIELCHIHDIILTYFDKETQTILNN